MSMMDVEQLESRRLFAGSAHIALGVLTVKGDAFARNTIVVSNSADGLSVDVSIQAAGKTVQASFLNSLPITSVLIRGGFGKDTITIDQTNSAVALDTVIDGRFGNDTIVA